MLFFINEGLPSHLIWEAISNEKRTKQEAMLCLIWCENKCQENITLIKLGFCQSTGIIKISPCLETIVEILKLKWNSGYIILLHFILSSLYN